MAVVYRVWRANRVQLPMDTSQRLPQSALEDTQRLLAEETELNGPVNLKSLIKYECTIMIKLNHWDVH